MFVPGSASTDLESDLRITIVHSPRELKCIIEHLTVVKLGARGDYGSSRILRMIQINSQQFIIREPKMIPGTKQSYT